MKFEKKHIKTVSLIVAIVLFVVYVSVQLFNGFKSVLTVEPATYVSEAVTESFDGFILRDETVVTSVYGGYADYLLSDGGYAKDGAEMVRVYQTSNDAATSELLEIDRKIDLIDCCVEELNTAGINDVKSANEAAYAALVASVSSGDTGAALSKRDGIIENLYSLELNSGVNVSQKIASAKAERKTLSDRRNALLAALGSYETIKSSGTGNFFYGTDGFETAYSSANIDKMTLSDFDVITSSQPQTVVNAVGCFAVKSDWYFAVPTDMTTASRYKEGKVYKVKFDGENGGVTLKMELYRIVREGDSEKAVLIFSSDRVPDGLGRERMRRAEIETKVYSGYRVRSEAVVYSGGEPGVYVLSGGVVEWKKIGILDDNGLYMIVSERTTDDGYAEWLNLNDSVIVSGRGIYEGKSIY